jgi:hypothetical protein
MERGTERFPNAVIQNPVFFFYWNYLNVFAERIANITDWEMKSITLYKDLTEEEIINSTKCNIHFSIARLTPKNSIRVSDIREVHVQFCHGKKNETLSVIQN